eukprot:103693-Amphidinium_carterae.2
MAKKQVVNNHSDNNNSNNKSVYHEGSDLALSYMGSVGKAWIHTHEGQWCDPDEYMINSKQLIDHYCTLPL